MKGWRSSSDTPETTERTERTTLEPTPAAAGARTEEGHFLAKGFKLEGTLDVSGPLRIDGEVKGTVRSNGRMTLGENARVEGEIHCGFLSVAGKVNGNVQCTERLEILRSGVVEGDVHAPSLGIEPGGILEGHCHMRGEFKAGAAGRGATSPALVARSAGDRKESGKSAGAQS